MSIDQLVGVQQDQLRQAEDGLIKAIQSVDEKMLLEDPIFVNQFANDVGLGEDDDDNLSKLSLTQLNNKYESYQQDISDLKQLKVFYESMNNIENMVNKSDSNLLDFHQIFISFKSHNKLVYNPNLIIYKHITKKMDQLRVLFINKLNDFLKQFIPDEFTVYNPEVLEEFNQLLLKNDLKLDYYKHLKSKWDKLLDNLENFNLLLEQDENHEKYQLILQNSTNSITFLTSIVNFIKFMNLINIDWLKHFFNSKISHFLNSKISTNIKVIVNNKQAIEELNQLISLAKPSGWNILTNFTDNTSIEKNLNKLYSEYTIDVYIDNIRTLFNETDLKNYISLEIDPVQSVVETTSKTPVADDWNEDWGDNWDENVPTEGEKSAKKNDDDWDKDWDDDWEVDKKKQPTTPIQSSPKKKFIKSDDLTKTTIKISLLPDKLLKTFEDFGSFNDDLIDTIFALSTVVYPTLDQSFLLYNDFQYLSKQSMNSRFAEYIESQWNRVLTQWYLELKILISSINITNEGVSTVEYELDEFNLDRISSIHQRLNSIISSSFNETNPKMFENLMIELIDFVNNWFITTVIQLDEITEFQCSKITAIIESLNNITVPIIIQLGRSKDSIKSYNKLRSLDYLVNNHLRDIMNTFYQGDLFSFETDELIKIIENIFVQSELRDQSIQEIVEIRSES